jgi:hypothetical protein
MAEHTDEPRQEADEQIQESKRPRKPEPDAEPPETALEDVAIDDRFQSTDN